jgi:hypothetical protein
MAKKILAEEDFAKGISVKNVKVPPMKATVTLDNAEAFKDYDDKKEQLILQKLIEVATSGLAKSRKEIKDAIEDFDEKFTKDTPADEKEAKERIKTFEAVCKKAAEAQESKVQKAVEDEWEMHQKRDAALTKLNLKFAVNIIVSSISLAVSITAAALSLGTLAVTLVGAAKTVVSTAISIKEFTDDRDKVAELVVEMDEKLDKIYSGPKMKGQAFKSAKEVAAAAGVPFIDSVGKFDDKVEDFLAKSARVDKDAQKLYEQANKLIEAIKKADKKDGGDDNDKIVDTMAKKTTALLTKIGELVKSIDADNTFYKVNKARAKAYEELNGKAISGTAKLVSFAKEAAEIASLAKEIVDLAVKLA